MKLVHDEKGAIAIEFIIVLFFILIPIFIGLVETARIINAQVVLDRAAREGAVCIMRGDPHVDPIKNVLTNANIDASGLQITSPNAGELKLTLPMVPLFGNFTRWVIPGDVTSYVTYEIP
ncbi:TadE/TadG family type IV pilus assembly protein [Halodesulfovibrio marinisediminis]|uniref:TadE-like protein n=1 Tax=Halodesulfovibrio marinisediminis DSM 17456 TaxID=1121457 RepID=A0A1N6EAD2_9BACT|nr:TadE family protein [Halodesulfovibrio marinisediminis]SIN79953.1 TadE-like protein [Halodesulfovibrio marinisediminis DSM 17456]